MVSLKILWVCSNLTGGLRIIQIQKIRIKGKNHQQWWGTLFQNGSGCDCTFNSQAKFQSIFYTPHPS